MYNTIHHLLQLKRGGVDFSVFFLISSMKAFPVNFRRVQVDMPAVLELVHLITLLELLLMGDGAFAGSGSLSCVIMGADCPF